MSVSPSPQLPCDALCPRPSQSPMPAPHFQGQSYAAPPSPCPSPPEPRVPVPTLTHLSTCSCPPLDPPAPVSSTWEAATPGVSPSSGPTTISHCRPPHLHGCISPLQPVLGLCPFREKQVSPLTASHAPAVPPTPNPKKGTQGPSTSHWGAQREGNPEHSHLLPPRTAPKSQGKVCTPLPSPDAQNTSRTQAHPRWRCYS